MNNSSRSWFRFAIMGVILLCYYSETTNRIKPSIAKNSRTVVKTDKLIRIMNFQNITIFSQFQNSVYGYVRIRGI